MIRIFFIVLAFGFGCAKDNEPKKSFAEKLELVTAKKVTYLLAQPDVMDDYGWLTDSKCDGLLINSLYAYAGGDVDLFLARNDEGQWFRHPAMDCLKKGESKSDISRDMFLGLFFPMFRDRSIETLQGIADYDEEHDGKMGGHDGSTDGKNRVTMTPTLRATLYELIYQLGGDNSAYRKVPQVWGPQKGFQAHLQVLHILIRAAAQKAIDDDDLRALKAQAERQPDNALFQAAYHKFKDGNQNRAVEILLKEDLFPSDRLPVATDRCAPYLFMHDKNDDDWSPCKGGKHSGTDLLFAYSVIMDESFGLRLTGND